jgi:hypothetical protein
LLKRLTQHHGGQIDQPIADEVAAWIKDPTRDRRTGRRKRRSGHGLPTTKKGGDEKTLDAPIPSRHAAPYGTPSTMGASDSKKSHKTGEWR